MQFSLKFGIKGGSDDRSATEQLALQLAYLQGGSAAGHSQSSLQQLQNSSSNMNANNHLNINHTCNNPNYSASGLHQQPSTPPGGGCNNSLCAGGSSGLINGVGAGSHSNLTPFSDISVMTSGAGDLLGVTSGMGNGTSMLNGK